MAQPAKMGLSSIVSDWLVEHLAKWVELGIIKPEQKAAIESLYLWPSNANVPREKSKPTNIILILEVIGAILIGLGILAFIAFGWPIWSSGFKLGLIITILAAVHVSAYYLVHKTKYVSAGEALCLLGNLAYGAGIWLVAQMYHLPSSFPNGMLIWAVGVLPMAFVFRSKVNYFLALILFLAWTLGESLGYKIPHPAFLMVLLGLLVPLAYYLESPTGLFMCLATGGLWLYLNLYLWADLQVSAFLLLPLALYGLLLLTLSNAHAAGAKLVRFRAVYQFLGWFVVLGTLATQPFYGVWAMDKPVFNLALLPWLFWVCSGLLLALSAFALLFPRWKPQDAAGKLIWNLSPFLAMGVLYWLGLPLIKFSALPSLAGVALVLAAHRVLTRSEMSPNLGIIIGTMWLVQQSLFWKHFWWNYPLFMLLGAWLYAYSWSLRLRGAKDAGLAYNFIGLSVALGLPFFLTFHSVNLSLFKTLALLPRDPDFWIVAGGLTAGWAWGLVRVWPQIHPKVTGGPLPEERLLALGLGLAPVALVVSVCTLPVNSWFTFTVNAVLLLVALMLLVTGYRRREGLLKVLGFSLLPVLVLCRFFETDWNLIFKAFLLIAVGIVVMVLGILFERNKEKVAVLD